MRLSRHVLFILEYYHPHLGGVETLFKSLVDQLATQGYRITIVTNRFDKKLPSTETIGAVTIKRYSFYNRYLFTFLAWIPSLKYARSADLIHTTSYNAAVSARIAAKITGIKSIITFHEYWGELWNRLPWISPVMRKLFAAFEKMIAGFKFDRFIAVSDYTKQALIDAGVEKHKVVRVYNGIDYSQFERRVDSDNDRFTFLFFGRVSYSKGVDLLLDAIDLIIIEKLNCKIKLIIPSEPTPIYQEVMNRLADNKYDEYVEVEHDLPFDVLKNEIAIADCVIIPSYSEGFCYAAAETMAIETPIISSGKGALAEVVTGTYIEMERHDAQALSKAMRQAVSENWNYKAPVKFQLEDTIAEYVKTYELLLI